MTSNSNQTVLKSEEEKKESGLNLLGYVVPWWVVILVVAVLVYVAYDNDMFKNVLESPTEVRTSGPSLNIQKNGLDVETPVQLKRYFNNY